MDAIFNAVCLISVKDSLPKFLTIIIAAWIQWNALEKGTSHVSLTWFLKWLRDLVKYIKAVHVGLQKQIWTTKAIHIFYHS